MKKTKSKLRLKTNTIRVLQGSALAQVHGGTGGHGGPGGTRACGPTNTCTDLGAGCIPLWTHTPGRTDSGNDGQNA